MGNRNMTLTASVWGSHSNAPSNLSSWHPSPVGWEERWPQPPSPDYFPLPRDASYVSCRVSVIPQIFKSNGEKKTNQTKKLCFTEPREKEKRWAVQKYQMQIFTCPIPPALVIAEKLRRFEMHFAHRLSINNSALHFISLIFPMGSLSSLI